MKILILAMLGLSSSTVMAELLDDAKLSVRNGALGKYVYRVVDDEGNAVSNALAHVWFSSYRRPQDKADWLLETDVNGMFVSEHRFNEKFSVGIDKHGYYHTHDAINYLVMTVLPVKEGKWQPYGETRTVVLKRMHNPHEMLGPEMPPQRKIRIYDKWLDFDLENGDFLPPMGNGRNADMLVRFKLKGQMPYDWSIKMDVSFTNHPCAGAYVLKKDVWSDMKSVYFADTNALYLTDFSFQYAREKGSRRPVVEKLGEDEYLVFRTRTKVDHDGRLISARYGKLYGPWNFEDAGGSQIQKVFLNKADNDANLEDAETARRARLSYRQRQELEWRRKNGLR